MTTLVLALFVAAVEEPSVIPAVPPAAPPSTEQVYKNVLAYRRQQMELQVRRVTERYWPGGAAGGRSPWYPPNSWESPRYWDPMAAPVTESTTEDWVIVKGSTTAVDELELARMAGDEGVARRIEDTRARRKMTWAVGFGAGSAVGIGAGIWLNQSRSSDIRIVASSLILLGTVSGVLALMFPAVGNAHSLSAAEAQDLVDRYNESLRQSLNLTPDDLAKYHAPR